jgi:hypothetical protein
MHLIQGVLLRCVKEKRKRGVFEGGEGKEKEYIKQNNK